MSDLHIHGLDHAAGVANLPTIPEHNGTPIRCITASQFSEFHLRHLLAHPPDNVLFPFLHGLEGQNNDQKTFFVSGNNSVVRPPPFRGLVWVACEDDLDEPTRRHLAREQRADIIDPHISDDYDEDSDDEEVSPRDVDHEDPRFPHSDPSSAVLNHVAKEDHDGETFAMDLDDGIDVLRDSQEAHMHPVAQRHAINPFTHPTDPTKQQPAAIQTANLHSHDRRDSTTSILSEATSASGSMFSSPTCTDSLSSSYPPETSVSPPMECPQETRSSRHDTPPLLTCTFRERDILKHVDEEPGQWEFAPAHVPPGISLRNFGIQVPIYATLSDIVVYSPKGVTPTVIDLAKRFRCAMDRKLSERLQRCGPMHGPDPDTIIEDENHIEGLVKYNVFVLDASEAEMRQEVPHLMVHMLPSTAAHTHLSDGESGTKFVLEDESIHPRQPFSPLQNTLDFALREKEEMRELTRATEILSVLPSDLPEGSVAAQAAIQRRDPRVGQVFLGNSDDVPISPDTPIGLPSSMFASSRGTQTRPGDPDCPFNSRSNPAGYDICVECHDLAPFPSVAQLRMAEEHLNELERRWVDRWAEIRDGSSGEGVLPPRPPPNANSVVHLPFPSSPPATGNTMATLIPMLRFLEKFLQPVTPAPSTPSMNGQVDGQDGGDQRQRKHGSTSSRRWSSVSSYLPSFPSFPSSSAHGVTQSPPAVSPPMSSSPASPPPPSSSSPGFRSRSHTSPPMPFGFARSRPLKILLYSADGYTESSVPALSLLMACKSLKLPEAYLELQIAKKRSFFVYNWDLGVLRRVEGRVCRPSAGPNPNPSSQDVIMATGENGGPERTRTPIPPRSASPYGGRPPAKSVSFARPSPPSTPSSSLPSCSTFSGSLIGGEPGHGQAMAVGATTPTKGRPRANTLPNLAVDHSSWFNDTRFDGSFPSRVLPFLYLGNLAHATNAYMLHALGITHVVSVGECALVPPSSQQHGRGYYTDAHQGDYVTPPPGGHGQFVHRKEGSLWIEEREGRIKVLDIKGVCDDGIDTLEPQLEPICEWIDRAREEGGKVLVHCRVGVSRSATVTIAYVMKHLNLPLVDSYLIVRSRRLSVLIQPNMRLLYNLCGWEIKLARERVGSDDPERLKRELARTLSWPYLSMEVHALNEKYLH